MKNPAIRYCRRSAGTTLPITKALASAMILAALTLAACSFHDEPARLRLDDLETRTANLETQVRHSSDNTESLQTQQEEQQKQIAHIQIAQNDLLAQQRHSETEQNVVFLVGQAARCYLLTEPYLDQLYPHVAPEDRMQHIADEMIQEFHRVKAHSDLPEFVSLILDISARCES